MTNGNGSHPADPNAELESYVQLTEEVNLSPSGPMSRGTGTRSVLGQTVESALREVLNWRPKAGDARGFRSALDQAFTLQEVEGHTTWSWVQRTYSVQTDMGALTGAQASLYTRAKAALDQSLPLLSGLYALRPDADTQDIESMRAIVGTQLSELVRELDQDGGPRVQRVDEYFIVLLGRDRNTGKPAAVTNPESVSGQLGELRTRFGMEQARVNTIDEEQNLTNFLILVDYVDTLWQNWDGQRRFFDRNGKNVFLGTQLVLLSQLLSAIAENVQESYWIMDSVFLGQAERQTTELKLGKNQARMTVAELLDWVDQVASEEGPRLIQDGGKDGVITFAATLERLAALLDEAWELSASHSAHSTPAFRHPRVQRVLKTLWKDVDEAARKAKQLKRQPPPVIHEVHLYANQDDQQSEITPTVVDKTFYLMVHGANFQEDARLLLTRLGVPEDELTPNPGTIDLNLQEQEISASFTLGRNDVGQWTVTVINSDGGRGTWDSIRIGRPPRAGRNVPPIADPPPSTPSTPYTLPSNVDKIEPSHPLVHQGQTVDRMVFPGLKTPQLENLVLNAGSHIVWEDVKPEGDSVTAKAHINKKAPLGPQQVMIYYCDAQGYAHLGTATIEIKEQKA